MVVRAHVFISGQVQGVSYRFQAREQAETLGLAGWIRNLAGRPSFAKASTYAKASADRSDGQWVEAVFEGEKEKVAEILKWCKEGSKYAVVEKVEVTWEEPGGLEGFEIRETATSS